MLIVCPSCASEYAIAADRIGPTGRVVRCASCREAWFIPPEDAALDEASAPAAEEPKRGPSFGPEQRKDHKAWLVAAALLAAAMGLAIFARTTVVRLVPESAAVFAMIGLPVNLVGLQLARVTSDVGQEGEAQVLVVSGEIANETGKPVQVPPLAFSIQGEKGATLYSWTEKKGGEELAPHAARPFQARLASPPPDGREVLVTFSAKGGAAAVASR
jgi:predicted Zn finger-like uncharacterized protein